MWSTAPVRLPKELLKRMAIYVVQRSIGAYIESDLSTDQVSIINLNTANLYNIRLDVQALNNLGVEQNWPFEVVEGYIKHLSLTIRYTEILSGPYPLTVHGANITIQPRSQSDTAPMFESMWSSMTSSKIFSEESFSKSPDTSTDKPSDYEGPEIMAQILTSMLNNIKLTCINSTIQVEHLPQNSVKGVGVVFNIDHFSYSDVSIHDPSQTKQADPADAAAATEQDEPRAIIEKSHTTKVMHFENISISTLEFSSDSRTFYRSVSSQELDKSNVNIEDDDNCSESGEKAPEEAESTQTQDNDVDEDRHVILCGKILGNIELRTSMKIAENMEGPKVELELNIDSILVFLSPRQLHLLVEVMDGFFNPDCEDHSNILGGKVVGKPMTASDYEHVEKDLQQQQYKLVVNTGLQGAHGWSSSPYELYSYEEQFVPLRASSARQSADMSDSITSLASDGLSIADSTMSSSTFYTETGTNRSNNKKMHRLEVDPSAEVSHLQIRLKSMAVVVLHEDKMVVSADEKCTLKPSGVAQMQGISERFFNNVQPHFLSRSYGTHFGDVNNALDVACTSSHLRFLGAMIYFETRDKSKNVTLSKTGFFETQKLELSECLYAEGVEHVKLITFNDPSPSESNFDKPNMRLSFKTLQEMPSRYRKGTNKTDFQCTLGKCIVELDVTIIDRISQTLYPQTICVINRDHPTHVRHLDDDTRWRQSINIKCPSLSVKLRFPIPDFRPPLSRIPWWKRHVRPDFLVIDLDSVLFQTITEKGADGRTFSLQCRSLHVTYYETETSDPLPVLKAGFQNYYGPDNPDNNCRFHVTVLPTKKPTLDDSDSSGRSAQPMPSSMFDLVMNTPKSQDGPFSTNSVVHESDTPHDKSKDGDPKELLLPGDKSEIDTFIKSTLSNSKVQLDITLPTLSMQLTSKHIYETIYNRINNDLLLWEPSVPKPNNKKYESAMYADVSDEMDDVFTLCKSNVSQDSDSDDSTNDIYEERAFFSTVESKSPSIRSTTPPSLQNQMSVLVRIKKGLLCLFAPFREGNMSNVVPGLHGEFLINVDDGNLFIVNGYKGDTNLGFVCLEARNALLHHCDRCSTPSHPPPLKDLGTAPGKHMHPTIYKSEGGMLANARKRGGNREMITVCVKIQADHMTHHVKNITVAAGFNKITLKHKMVQQPNSWVSQLIDFFTVHDYPISEYRPKENLTELFIHLWDSGILYDPEKISVKAVLSLASLSISSNLSVDSNATCLRIIAEECALLLSKKDIPKGKMPLVNLKRDFVNIMDFGLFEISLKVADKKMRDVTSFDLRASNDMIHLRTCADSAVAFTELVKYLASNGDLVCEDDSFESKSNHSSPRHTVGEELLVMDPQQNAHAAECISQTQKDKMCALIDDAIEEDETSSTASRADQQGAYYSQGGAKLFYFPGENQQAQDEPQNPLPQVTRELGSAPFEPTLADTDEEFCFIDKEPGFDFLPKSGEPEMKWLTNETVRLMHNHFSVPMEKNDPLRPPKELPVPHQSYTLCEMSIIWHMYGGNDFGPPDKERIRRNVTFRDHRLSGSVRYSNNEDDEDNVVRIGEEKIFKSRRAWLLRGGPNRNHDILMELQLNKIRFVSDIYPGHSKVASRKVLVISDFEIRDKLETSEINKFLYQYTSQVRPKQANAQMFVAKIYHVKTDPKSQKTEASVKISMLPLRFNIDQDALLFLITFLNSFGENKTADESSSPSSSSKHNTPVHQMPVMNVGIVDEDDDVVTEEVARDTVNENLMLLLESNKSEQESTSDVSSVTVSLDEDGPTYFRKVFFEPDVPIRLDYQGRHIDISCGSLHRLLMGLMQLNCSELRLKRITYRHGILGWDRLITFLVQEWLRDIRRNQLPSLLSGVGPVRSLMQFFNGIVDLVKMPIEQYKKDGRILRGLHRGANSFTTSTVMACLELTTRFFHLIQVISETAFDMLTPGPSVRAHPKNKSRRKRYGQPKGIREGVAKAVMLVKEGLEETGYNIVQVASHEHEQKGYSGAVGGVIRQIPPTIIKPIIIASEATNNLLCGVRSSLVPDAKRDADEKWKADDYDRHL